MRAFLESSYPRFLGLTGTPEQIDAAKRTFHVFARRRVDPEDPDGYAVPHTAFTYLLDPSGRFATHWTDATTPETVLSELHAILAGPATVTAGPEPGRS
jgi:protein SCO1/2